MKRNILTILIIILSNFAVAGTKEWRVVSEMPVPVSGAVAFTHDSLIYIFGGHNSNDFVTPAIMQIYNPLLNSWRMDSVGTLQNSRYGANGGIWQGNAYFFGGYRDSSLTNLDIWGIAGNTEISLSDKNDNFNRYFASSEIYDGKIYCFGGYSVNSEITDRAYLPYIFIYDINSHTIETEIKSEYTKELPYYQMTARIHERIFILGGTFNGVLKTISYFHTESNTIHNLEKKMATARYGGTAHALGDSAIILIGGWNGRDEVLSEVEIINLKNNGPNSLPDIKSLNNARAEHVSVIFGDDLYVFGGRNTTNDNNVSSVEKLADFNVTAIDNNQRTPFIFELDNNYPNPFNPSTVISYQLSTSSDVFLKVYDICGRLIATLVNERQSAGEHKVTFEASDLAGGVYFYKLTASKQSQTKRMLLIR